MEIVSIERKTFEAMVAKFDHFVRWKIHSPLPPSVHFKVIPQIHSKVTP